MERETGRFIRTNRTEEDSFDDILALTKRTEHNKEKADIRG